MDKKTKIKFNILAIICILIFSFSLAPKTLQNDTYYTIATRKAYNRKWNRWTRPICMDRFEIYISALAI